MARVSPVALASELLTIIHEDADRLERIDFYLHGHHDEPYMPRTADAEYQMLARRAISNWMPLLVGTPAQALYVDGFRAGRKETDDRGTPEWTHWQNSRLDARQAAVHRAALTYGHSFTVTEFDKRGKVMTRGLSPLRTAALYEDAANDHDPFAALTIVSFPSKASNGNGIKGRAKLWDGTHSYEVRFDALHGDQKVTWGKKKSHGSPECPVTRFAATVDLEGRTIGVVEPMIPLQNRINQTVFDLLVAQTYGSFKVRWATGMAPPTRVAWVNAEGTEVDADTPGAQESRKPIPMDHNARRFLFAEDHEARFGSLDETPLDGYINSIDMSIRHLAAVSQTPPHHLLGQIANLSAEALQAAETSLSRKVEEYRKAFGESWERVFRLAGALGGDNASYEDASGEVLWRDMEQRSLAQSADALGKLADQLDIPKHGLWTRVPGVTQNEIDWWNDLRESEDYELQMAEALSRASSLRTTTESKPVTAEEAA
jgi:hypothetical protein